MLRPRVIAQAIDQMPVNGLVTATCEWMAREWSDRQPPWAKQMRRRNGATDARALSQAQRTAIAPTANTGVEPAVRQQGSAKPVRGGASS